MVDLVVVGWEGGASTKYLCSKEHNRLLFIKQVRACDWWLMLGKQVHVSWVLLVELALKLTFHTKPSPCIHQSKTFLYIHHLGVCVCVSLWVCELGMAIYMIAIVYKHPYNTHTPTQTYAHTHSRSRCAVQIPVEHTRTSHHRQCSVSFSQRSSSHHRTIHV